MEGALPRALERVSLGKRRIADGCGLEPAAESSGSELGLERRAARGPPAEGRRLRRELGGREIRRASCRERVEVWVGGGSGKRKNRWKWRDGKIVRTKE